MRLEILKGKGILNSPAKDGDAGYDLFATKPPVVVGSVYQGQHYKEISHIEYDTELRIEPKKHGLYNDYEFFMLLYPRSSIIKTNLILANSVGVIDSGYRGNIKVCFKYISQPIDMKIVKGKNFQGGNADGILTSVNPQRIYQEGDRIAQLVPCRHTNIRLRYVNELSSSERGEGGFGSTNL
jgi:dUTP pyrophosphatase